MISLLDVSGLLIAYSLICLACKNMFSHFTALIVINHDPFTLVLGYLSLSEYWWITWLNLLSWAAL